MRAPCHQTTSTIRTTAAAPWPIGVDPVNGIDPPKCLKHHPTHPTHPTLRTRSYEFFCQHAESNGQVCRVILKYNMET